MRNEVNWRIILGLMLIPFELLSTVSEKLLYRKLSTSACESFRFMHCHNFRVERYLFMCSFPSAPRSLIVMSTFLPWSPLYKRGSLLRLWHESRFDFLKACSFLYSLQKQPQVFIVRYRIFTRCLILFARTHSHAYTYFCTYCQYYDVVTCWFFRK